MVVLLGSRIDQTAGDDRQSRPGTRRDDPDVRPVCLAAELRAGGRLGRVDRAPGPGAPAAGDRPAGGSFRYPGADRRVLSGRRPRTGSRFHGGVGGGERRGKDHLGEAAGAAVRPDAGTGPRGRSATCGRSTGIPGGTDLRRFSGLREIRIHSPAQAVGIGDLPRIDAESAMRAALDRGGATTSWSSDCGTAWIPSWANVSPKASSFPAGSGSGWPWPADSCGPAAAASAR